jgi:hypothetical protein
LTAAHVVRDATGLKVEIHRFNYGGRVLSLTEGGGWPRLVPATVAAIDPGGDVALVLIRGMTALPFVARFDLEVGEPKRGEVLTSVGVDRGLHLTRWQTTIQGPALVDGSIPEKWRWFSDLDSIAFAPFAPWNRRGDYGDPHPIPDRSHHPLSRPHHREPGPTDRSLEAAVARSARSGPR